MNKEFLQELFDYVRTNQPAENELVDYALAQESCPCDRSGVEELFAKTYIALHQANIINEESYNSLKEKILAQEDLFFDVIYEKITEYLLAHPLTFEIQQQIDELQAELDKEYTVEEFVEIGKEKVFEDNIILDGELAILLNKLNGN